MDWLSKNRAWIAGSLLLALAFVARFLAVNQTTYASGWDGYYYVMQVHSWIEMGHLQSPDFSLIYPFLTLLALFTDDYVLAYKVGAALLSAFLILSTYLFVIKQAGETALALLAGAYLTFSPTLVYLGVQFPKNVMGLIFFVWFLHFILRRKYLGAALCFTLAILTHRMIGGLCLLIGFFNVIGSINWKYLAGATLVVLMLSFLPGILHVSDLQRLEGEFSLVPQLAPYSLYLIYQNSISAAWIADLFLISLMTVFAGYTWIRSRELGKEVLTWIFLIALCVFPFFVMKPGSLGFRFLIVAPVFLVVHLALQLKVKAVFAGNLAVILLALSLVSFRSYKPAAYDPPNVLYERLVSGLVDKFSPEQYPLVIAHKGLAEMIIFKTDFDALNWAPPSGTDPRGVLRVIHNLDSRDFRSMLGKGEAGKVERLGPGYYVAPEVLWLKFLDEVHRKARVDILSRINRGKNPMDQRPYYLSKGKDL